MSQSPVPHLLTEQSGIFADATTSPREQLAFGLGVKLPLAQGRHSTENFEANFKALEKKADYVKLLVVHEQYVKAGKAAQDVVGLAVEMPFNEKHTELAAVYMRTLAKELCRKGEAQAAISLLHAASKVCERIPDPEMKLKELMFTAETMQPVAGALADDDKVTQFKQHGMPVLGDIVRKMEHVACADKTSKTIKQAWCLKFVSTCCRNLGDHEQSLERDKEAIELMTSRFGSSASKYRVFGVCQHNLATTYKNLSQHSRAEGIYLKAIESFQSANDWPNEERKRKSITLSTSGLNEIQRFLSKN